MDTVVLVPSLGRPASDFNELCKSLESAGFKTLAVDPPHSLPGEPTLHDLADYVIDQINGGGIASFHLIGHAFGNRLSRMITAKYPERVKSLTLLAAGGYVEMEKTILESLLSCFDETLSPEVHLSHVSQAFFAPGNDASVWRDGWMRDVMILQQRALQRVSRDEWWDAEAPRVLVVQALQDVIAPVGNGQKYALDHPEITKLVEINGAGHAMLPEQPEKIASAVIEFLQN